MGEDMFDYLDWLAANPPPDLVGLIKDHGGYDKVTHQAWLEYDAAVRQWESDRRDRLLGSHTWAMLAELKGRPSRKPRR